MVSRITASAAKAKLLAILDEVAAGDEVEVTKHGRVVARIVPASGPKAIKGSMAGVAISAAPEEQLFSTDERWELS